ncbi:outer membrane protein transport protein [Paucibacter sp. AS339]|uniref:OmpP1/FadL family transporter n=1 Tax=Paucibacter hankyongi TaxID=3133434 RepID=UPI0030A0E582
MRFHLSSLSLALLGGLCAGNALASGYHFGSQSAASQGTANANAAEAADASLLFYNPAGMSRLSGTQASGVLNVVVPSGSYEDQGSITALRTPTGGGNGGKFVKPTIVPHGYLTHQLSNQLSVGMAMFVPFGSKSEYDKDWAGRYNTIGTELKSVALNPSLSFKVNPTLSLGAGVTAQYIQGDLSKAADFGSGVIGLIVPGLPPSLQGPLTAALVPKLAANPNSSGRVDVSGKDWGYGFNLGLMLNYDENTRFGIAYRSKISHTLKGDAEWQVKDQAAYIGQVLGAIPALAASGTDKKVVAALLAKYQNGGASLDVVTPESLSFSVFKQMDSRLAVMADATLTRHSRFQELRIDFEQPLLPDSNTPQRWVKTVRASFGVNYQLNDAIKLRGGLAFDQSPVSDANRTPSIPDGDRKWISAGLNWKLDKQSSVDLAMSYIDVATGAVNNFDNGGVTKAGVPSCDSNLNTSSCATIKGNYKLSSGLIGVQYNRQF